MTGGCTSDPECDDGNDCTIDECIDNVCVHSDEPDGTPCPDGLFCNGEETCRAGVCTESAPPCMDPNHCDEDADLCIACLSPGDGDADGRVGMGDFRSLFDCRTPPLGPIDPPAYAEGCACFDFDEDGDVDLADFASFQAVFERIAPATVQLIARTAPGVDDQVDVLPVGGREFPLGTPIFVEVWAQTEALDGLASVYVDVRFDPAKLHAESFVHTDVFDLFPMGTADNDAGVIEDLGGSHLAAQGCVDQVGRAPRWARAALIEIIPEALGQTTVVSAKTDSPFTVSVCGTFELPVTEFNERAVTIVSP